MDSNMILIQGAVIALMMATTFGVISLVRRRIGSRVVESEITAGSEWSLGTVAEPGKRYNLCLSFRIEYTGGEDDYGLMADYECQAGGSVLVDEKAGVGCNIPQDGVRNIGSQHNCDLTAVLGHNRYRATVILFSMGPFQERMELRAAGRLEVSRGTVLKSGTIFLST